MLLYRLNVFNFSEIKVFTIKNIYKIYFINQKNFFKINVNSNNHNFFINDSTKSFSINLIKERELIKFFDQIQFVLTHIYSSFFFKIKFTGKGYRLQSFYKKKIINFTFGYSHIYYMSLGKTKYKRINKYRYFFELFDLYKVNRLKNIFKKIKPINKYTLRGLRITRAVIIKRKGRKSPNI